jgi:uncharacterized repeat protein (TIGR03847 family)
VDLGPVDRITADAIGEPGSRTFYIQARAGGEMVTVIVEKEQVQLLAASVFELLTEVPDEAIRDEPGMELEQPFDPRWRARRLSLGFYEDRGLFKLEIEELPEDVEDPDIDPETVTEKIQLWASPAQMLALSRHGASVAARGRPTCQFCGNPIDPEGHACPAMNGHSRRD